MSKQRRFALALYRAILQSHRRALPSEMRALGDEYVRSEFKLHKTASAKHLAPFFEQWMAYLQELNTGFANSGAGAQRFGRDLAPEELSALNEEQQERLQTLQEEVKKSVAGGGDEN